MKVTISAHQAVAADRIKGPFGESRSSTSVAPRSMHSRGPCAQVPTAHIGIATASRQQNRDLLTQLDTVCDRSGHSHQRPMMDPPYMQFKCWDFQPQAELLPMPDYQHAFSVAPSPAPSTTASDLSSIYSSREETIQGLHEARRRKRREQNKAAQRKFRQRKEQTEVQLRTGLIDAEKNIELLQKDNSRLLQELCSIRRENLLWQTRHSQGEPSKIMREELAELDAISKRVVEATTAAKGTEQSR